MSEDISDGVGVASGHLFGVQSPERVRDLGMTGKPSSLVISAEMNEALANKKWQQLTIH